ncbi:MAG TPA: hypothetical protein VFE25_04865, partial [Opitutaceae bacterium]|nr:hypothetical protein [Opitutaceae bacterium]
LEKVTGVMEPNISAWRRRSFGDFTELFRFDEPAAAAPRLPSTGAPLSRALYEADNLPEPVLPGAQQVAPKQEPGRRNRLPKGTV